MLSKRIKVSVWLIFLVSIAKAQINSPLIGTFDCIIYSTWNGAPIDTCPGKIRFTFYDAPFSAPCDSVTRAADSSCIGAPWWQYAWDLILLPDSTIQDCTYPVGKLFSNDSIEITLRQNTLNAYHTYRGKRQSGLLSSNTLPDLRSLLIYPNPNNGTFIIEHSLQLIDEIQIIDLVGRVVYSSSTLDNYSSIILPEHFLGIYLVKIFTRGNPILIKKVIVN